MSVNTHVDDIAVLSDAELEARLEELIAEERTISRRRSSLHDRIDFVQAGVAVSAEQAADQLTSLREAEREVSNRRNALHAQIDEPAPSARLLPDLTAFWPERGPQGSLLAAARFDDERARPGSTPSSTLSRLCRAGNPRRLG